MKNGKLKLFWANMGEFSFLLRGDNNFLNFIMYIIIDVLYCFHCMQYLNYCRTIKIEYFDQLKQTTSL